MYGVRQRYVGGLGAYGRFTCYICCAFKFPRNPLCTRIKYFKYSAPSMSSRCYCIQCRVTNAFYL